jgi:membrane protein YdbS with pleckstrin-like domain
MAENQTTFEIDASRLVRYFRLRYGIPVLFFYFMLALTVWAVVQSPKVSLLHPIVLMLFALVAVATLLAIVGPPIQVRALRYWMDGTTLRIDQGNVVRQCKSIPLDRVTDIEMAQGPLMRACGVWTLKIQTAGSTDREPEGRLWATVNAESVRDAIVAHRDKAVGGARDAT